jgi:hypothetical protein
MDDKQVEEGKRCRLATAYLLTSVLPDHCIWIVIIELLAKLSADVFLANKVRLEERQSIRSIVLRAGLFGPFGGDERKA